MDTNGKFIISLDLELLWGVRDKKTPETYGKNILGGREALPKILEIFDAYRINATFATVGLLFAADKEEMINHFPARKPSYQNPNLSPYHGHFKVVESSELVDKYHFALSLIELIRQYPNHEIASHTFSHYYCLEKGQDPEDFRADLKAAIEIAEKKGITLKSLVFPRNQFDEAALEVCRTMGISAYRGNEKSWFYDPTPAGKLKTLFSRALKLLDTYINISGHNCPKIEDIVSEYPFNIPSSSFLRPFSYQARPFDGFRLRRIKNSMKFAAKEGRVFHLWWHPHNFGVHQNENFALLEEILSYFKLLNREYHFESLTMAGLVKKIRNGNRKDQNNNH